jgi:hypothetical protein
VRNRLLLVIVAVVALAIVVLWLAHRSRPPAPLPPRATPEPKATVPRPSPTAELSPTPEEVEHHTRVVVSWRSEPTPTPSPAREVPTVRPGPSPTPEVAQCLAVRYSTSMIASAPGQVLVDIQTENGCGRDLGPLDVWFWVAGYRQGDLVQSVQGHPFDPIPKGGDGEVVIALPGSIDWYDHIEVQVMQPGHR